MRASPASRAHPWRTVGILCAGTLTYAISQTTVIPALPAMQLEFATDASSVAWVMSAFFVASAVSTGIAGRLGDMFGKKRAFVLALAAYGFGAIICAFAGTLELMVAGRVIMGGGGGIVALAYSISRDEMPRRSVSVALGTVAMTIGLGAGLGMVVGGFIAEHLGFHWSFVLAAVLCAASIAAAVPLVPESPIRSPARVDWLGAALLFTGLGSLLFAIARASIWGWTAAKTVAFATVGTLVLGALLAVERRRAQPLVHVPTLTLRPVLATNLASLCMGMGQIAASILVVQYAQVPVEGGGLGAGATQAGLFLVPYSVLMVAGSQIAGRIAWRVRGKLILIGGALIAAGSIGGLAVAPAEELYLYALPGLAGLGISMTLVAAPVILAKTVHPARTAEANGINTIARNVGQSLGAQVTATLLAAHVIAASGGIPTAEGFSVAFAFSGLACAATALFALLIRRPPLVEVPTGVDTKDLAGRAVAASEGDDLGGDVLATRRPA